MSYYMELISKYAYQIWIGNREIYVEVYKYSFHITSIFRLLEKIDPLIVVQQKLPFYVKWNSCIHIHIKICINTHFESYTIHTPTYIYNSTQTQTTLCLGDFCTTFSGDIQSIFLQFTHFKLVDDFDMTYY